MIRVVVNEGEAEHETLVRDRTTVRIGRDAANDVVVRDRFVSARHGELHVGADGVTFEDFLTTNGSRVVRGGRTVPVDATTGHRVLLRDGDELLLGDKKHPVRVRLEFVAAKVFGSRGVVPPPRSPVATEFDATHAETLVLIPSGFERDVLLALHRLTTRLSAHLATSEILDVFAECTLEAFPRANHVAVWMASDAGGDFCPVVSRNRRGETGVRAVSRTVRDQVLARGRAVAFTDGEEDFDAADSLHDSSVRAGLCAPLWDGRTVTGLVQVDYRGLAPMGQFGANDLEILAVFAHQAAMALRNARLHANLQRSVEQAITGLVAALEAKDAYTAGHSAAVAALCEEACRHLGLDDAQVRTVRRAALLHDVGKIGIPYDVLNKRGALSQAEFHLLRSHPELGARILAPFDFLEDVAPIVLHHHERWDGTGYPAGLRGTDIPLGARILAVCDAWHSLVHDRAYRPGIAPDLALKEIQDASGRQFDPQVVDAFSVMVASSIAGTMTTGAGR